MTIPAKIRPVFRLRAQVRSALVMEATPNMLALDAELRAHETRLPVGVALIIVLGLSLGAWGGIFALAKGLL